MAPIPDFEQLLQRAQRGDSGAIETIYVTYAPLVLGYLRSNHSPSPEDVTADVFVSVIRDIGRFDGEETQFRSWLLTISHRRMVDELRRAGRRLEDPAPPDLLPGLAGVHTPADIEAVFRLEARGVLSAIDDLTPDQRQVVLLRIVADLPVREISRVLGKPETAVKALLHRAMARLHKALAESGALVDS